MEETYTFSRALHLMRYGGKKMRCTLWDISGQTKEMFVIGDSIHFTWIDGVKHDNYRFTCEEIMGSWVEVK